MKIKRHALQLLLFLMPLAFASALMADETEIYFSDKSGDVPPNVLFLIDGSGSMGQEVTTDTESPKRTRMQILKDSFDTVMANAPSNLNVGLMHYANHGLGDDYWWSSIKGVNFPATGIDEKVQPLISTYQGDDNLPNPATGDTTVRDFLAEVVGSWDANGYTPIVDALYEAAHYWRGEPVGWGLGHSSIGWAAHPLTYDSSISCTNPKVADCVKTWGTCNADIVPGSCKTVGYNSCRNWVDNGTDDPYCENNDYTKIVPIETCKHNVCESWSGTPSYQSPIEYKCQANYLVLMSDGKPEYPYYPGLDEVDGTHYYPPSVQDPAATEVDAAVHTDQIKVGTKLPAYLGSTCKDKPFGYASGTCGSELTNWLATVDQNADLAGDQFIDTYAVAFAMADQPDEAKDYLESLVTTDPKEKGFFKADTAEELAGAFNAILKDVNDKAMSFASPTYTIDTDTMLSHSNEVYIPMFAADRGTLWAGNVKKFYRNAKGEIVDAYGRLVLDNQGRFLDTALDAWSSEVGAGVTVGGAANQLPEPGDRNVFTDVSDSSTLKGDSNLVAVNNENITDAMLLGILEQLNVPASNLSDDNGDGLSCYGWYNDCEGNRHEVNEVWNYIFGNYDNCVVIADVTKPCPSADLLTDDERTTLINFIRGVDENGNPRNHMGDMLNTKPIILRYGDKTRVFVATNEGFLHSLDSVTGEEAWAFMPSSLLANARLFMANQGSQSHVYGIDGPITVWMQDWNGNGRIEVSSVDRTGDGKINADDNDKAYLYFGLRRGGNVYYALDVSDPDSPVLKWKKQNTEGQEGAWDELGEAWSKPTLAKMRIGSISDNELKDVLVFGGGYDWVKDIPEVDQRSADSTGRDVFIVDAKDGTLLWSLKKDVYRVDGGKQEGDDGYPIKHSIPGDIRVMDMDRNGALDRLYFADTGGNVWRVDMDHDLRDQDESLYNYGDARLTKIAALGTGGADADGNGGNSTDPRKFFYEPDTALLQHNGQSLLTIALGSGYRTHPMNTVIDDRFYVLVDPNVYKEPPADWVALTDDDLTNRTDEELTNDNNLLHGVHKGWYYDFDLKGEKVLAPASTFLNKVIFTTFAPVDADGNGPTDDPCDTPPNSSRAYVLDLLTGAPVANLDRDVDNTKDDFVVAGINEILNSAQIIFRPPEYTVSEEDGSISCGDDDCSQTVEIRVGKMSMPLMDDSNSNNTAGANISESTDLSNIIPRIFWRDNSVSTQH